MVLRYCRLRRRRCLKWLEWCVCISGVLILISWTYRSWVMDGVHFLSSPLYRECAYRRSHFLSHGHKESNLFVTLADHGRLGNWMFQYASLLGIAKANGFTPYLLNSHSLSFGFQLTHVKSRPAECLISLEDPKPISYVDKFYHLPQANITLDGYFQSWKYFESINSEIRREFKFREDLQLRIDGKFNEYVGSHVQAGREVISIHVRRGDLMTRGAQRLGFRPTPASYFANAMRYMVKRHPYSVFLVLSDDVEWCRDNIPTLSLLYTESAKGHHPNMEKGQIVIVNDEDGTQELVTSKRNVDKLFPKPADDQRNISGDIFLRSPPLVLAPRGSTMIDFGLLSRADHSILSSGTYGWWGAWLAGGEVVYYDNWLVEDHIVHTQWTPGDFYPPHWVALSGGWSDSSCTNVFLVLAAFFYSMWVNKLVYS